jgi:hypothetical protein
MKPNVPKLRSGATSSEHAAPTGLADFIGSGFYKDAAPTALHGRRFVCRHHFHGPNKKFSTRFGNRRIQQQLGNPGFKVPILFGLFESRILHQV